MGKRTIFETVDREGNAIGLYHDTWDAAVRAAVEMDLSVRRSQLGDDSAHRTAREPQELTLETMLPNSAA